jgi:4-hydroxybenzoate polyprenyltransferase
MAYERTARFPIAAKAWDLVEFVKLQHSLFAMPFALMSALLAGREGASVGQIGWIVVAMVGARSSAMGFNRIVDRELDAANPRTAARALPARRLTLGQAWAFVAVSTAVFVYAAYRLNALALWLSPVALAIVWGYSFTKRFTSMSHLVLGLSLGIAPAGAWIALRGTLSPTAMLLSAAVVLWTAGFDVIYACQDVRFDLERGLHSLPARMGMARALLVARLFHVGMLALLVAAGWAAHLGAIYYGGLVLVAGLLVLQHRLVRPNDLSRVNAAFFTANGVLSVALLLLTVADVLLCKGVGK